MKTIIIVDYILKSINLSPYYDFHLIIVNKYCLDSQKKDTKIYHNFIDFLLDLTKYFDIVDKKINIISQHVFMNNWNIVTPIILDYLLEYEYFNKILKNYIKVEITLSNKEEIKTICVNFKDIKSMYNNLNITKELQYKQTHCILNLTNIYEIDYILEVEPLLHIIDHKDILKSDEIDTFYCTDQIDIINKSLDAIYSYIYKRYIICNKLKINYIVTRTAAAIATKLWRKNIPIDISKKCIPIKDWIIEDFIRLSYRGGISYCEKKILKEDIFIYDVKSEYPAMMIKKHKYPIGMHEAIICTNWKTLKQKLNKENKLGFVLCKIKQISTIPVAFLKTRNIDNVDSLIMPSKQLRKEYENAFFTKTPELFDTWEDIYTTADLLYAETLNCYEITPIKGYLFEQTTKLFDKFVHNLYELKEHATDDKDKEFYKLILNSLSGKLGIQLDSFKYYITPNLKIASIQIQNSSYVHLASFITAYGRIFLHKVILNELKQGNQIYYYHTDSIFCSKALQSRFISKKKDNIYKRLGKFKPIITPPNKAILLSLNNYICISIKNEIIQKKGTYTTWKEFTKELLSEKGSNLNIENDLLKLIEKKNNTNIPKICLLDNILDKHISKRKN